MTSFDVRLALQIESKGESRIFTRNVGFNNHPSDVYSLENAGDGSTAITFDQFLGHWKKQGTTLTEALQP